ncbi:hypothetical protein PHYBOEH_009307 [Phytophthora boehmeriae]|uniref:Helicase-associated domain-containing protein n=1 Tax=Phytophthora boehmeriae TaxID=109152 RepID=A0A8T1VXV7_9STRA|nr:hypothetical protein PHYBOEH_009307 [Phytophthora boehmeriae]
MVPVKFVVPSGDPQWPRETWGYPLGPHTKHLRMLKNTKKALPSFAITDLQTLNFPWHVRQYKWDVMVLPALRKYYELHGNTKVAMGYVVPKDDEAWPKHLRGLGLGKTVASIKYADAFAPQRLADREELERLEFSTELKWRRERTWSDRILPALTVFRRQFGHCNVHFNFVVPDSPEWPKVAQGMRLGATVANIRSKGNYEDLADRDKDKLKAIDFVWSPEEERWKDKILPALETYAKVNGHGWVPVDFVVPDEEPWSEQARGLRLGNVFMKIRHTGAYASYVEKDRDRLQAIGIDFTIPYDPRILQKTSNQQQ